MPALLHLETLRELYPTEQEGRAFATRARTLLLNDRLALQNALARNAFDTAHELVHRLQGSVSFLSVSAESALEALRSLSQALLCCQPEGARDSTDKILRYLECLEDELAQFAQACGAGQELRHHEDITGSLAQPNHHHG